MEQVPLRACVYPALLLHFLLSHAHMSLIFNHLIARCFSTRNTPYIRVNPYQEVRIQAVDITLLLYNKLHLDAEA